MPWAQLSAWANVPDAMLHTDTGAIRQWICWKAVDNPKKGKPDKVPIDPRTGRGASSTDPKTWARFWDAVNFYRDWHGLEHTHKGAGGKVLTGHISGIGFVLTPPWIGIDLDAALEDQILPWAMEIVEKFDSYTEISPSGSGLRIFATGALPFKGRKVGNVEIYQEGRYLTVTGNCLPGREALRTL